MVNKLNLLLLLFIGIFSTIASINTTYVSASGFKGEVVQGDEYTKYDDIKAANNTLGKVKVITAGLSGVCALTLLLIFIKKAFDLGATAHNSSARQNAVNGLLFTGIAFALLGGTSVFFAITSGLLG